jgi:hypothetical protein
MLCAVLIYIKGQDSLDFVLDTVHREDLNHNLIDIAFQPLLPRSRGHPNKNNKKTGLAINVLIFIIEAKL